MASFLPVLHYDVEGCAATVLRLHVNEEIYVLEVTSDLYNNQLQRLMRATELP